MNEQKIQSAAAPAVHSSDLVGCHWKCVINGKRHKNSKRYAATYTGDVQGVLDCTTIYDVLRELADYFEVHNADMDHPDSFQVTLYPPNYKLTDSRRP